MYKYLPSPTKVQVWMLLWISACVLPCNCFFKTIHHVLTRVAPHLKERVYMFTGDILGMGKVGRKRCCQNVLMKSQPTKISFRVVSPKTFCPKSTWVTVLFFNDIPHTFTPVPKISIGQFYHRGWESNFEENRVVKAFSNFNSMSWTHERHTMEKNWKVLNIPWEMIINDTFVSSTSGKCRSVCKLSYGAGLSKGLRHRPFAYENPVEV